MERLAGKNHPNNNSNTITYLKLQLLKKFFFTPQKVCQVLEGLEIQIDDHVGKKERKRVQEEKKL